MLKNETIIETPEDVAGVLELCHVLVKDQSDGSGMIQTPSHKDTRRQGPHLLEREEMAEEQGWVARMIHLFRAESLDVQFEVSIFNPPTEYYFECSVQLLQVARKHLEAGGERMRFTFPALITSATKLCRRYKSREHLVSRTSPLCKCRESQCALWRWMTGDQKCRPS